MTSHPLQIFSLSRGIIIVASLYPPLRIILSASSGKLLLSLRSGHEDFDDVPVKCPPDTLLELHDLLVRSHCSLTKLSLVNAGINEHLFSITALCPRLRNLTIEFNEWTGEADSVMTTLVHQIPEVRAAEGMYWHVFRVPSPVYTGFGLC